MFCKIREIDTEQILSTNPHWIELQHKWGEPVDLDISQAEPSQRIVPAPSVSTLNRTTFDSAKIIQEIKNEHLNRSLCDYTTATMEKSFYFISGNIFSKESVEDICMDIDGMFSDLNVKATSTLRLDKIDTTNVLSASATISALSYDDTLPRMKKRSISKSLQNVVNYFENLFRIGDTK